MEQLPEIKPDAPDDGKIYLDQAEYQTEVDGALLHAVKRQAMAFIPSQEGLFTLPEVTIDWWDVVNNKQQKAVLPARVIKVIKADNGFADQPQRSNIKIEKKPRKAEPDSAKNPSPTSDTLTTKIVDADTTQLWKTISAMLLIAWIITVLLWRKTLRRQIAELKERDLFIMAFTKSREASVILPDVLLTKQFVTSRYYFEDDKQDLIGGSGMDNDDFDII
jgi:hypothetical protein